MKILFILFFLFPTLSLAQDLSFYKLGTGARFQLKMDQVTSEVSMAVVESSKSRLSVESYFQTKNSLLPVQMWQRYQLSLGGNGKLKVTDGYIFMPQLSTPQRLTKDYLQGYDGVQMNSFLIGSKKDLKKYFVAAEKVKVPASKALLAADHYRVVENGQTVDFWISEQAKPFGLVKLVSQGEKLSQRYQMELTGLIKNVAPKIDPRKSKPLDKLGRAFLPKLGPSLFHN